MSAVRRLGRLLLPPTWAGALLLGAAAMVPRIQADPPVVRAVLFYSPSCPHCHKVIVEDLPPLIDQYAGRLEIVGVDTSTAAGYALYEAAIERFDIPPERRGVPTLIVGEVVLVGSVEIPEQLPAWIDHYLALGGVGWPDIPGLAQALAATEGEPGSDRQPSASPGPEDVAGGAGGQAAATATPAPVAMATPLSPGWNAGQATLAARFASDPVGNAAAIGLLVFMTFSVGRVLPRVAGRSARARPAWHEPAIPVLCLVGAAIAGYLTYVEVAQVTAVCGPIGDCNTVHQSEYAVLFGVLPVGLLGLVGYVAIAAAWLARRVSRGPAARRLGRALFWMTVFGVLFSIYLTFLEPFVIGANCAWCLASALIMTGLLWLTAPGASQEDR